MQADHFMGQNIWSLKREKDVKAILIICLFWRLLIWDKGKMIVEESKCYKRLLRKTWKNKMKKWRLTIGEDWRPYFDINSKFILEEFYSFFKYFHFHIFSFPFYSSPVRPTKNFHCRSSKQIIIHRYNLSLHKLSLE